MHCLEQRARKRDRTIAAGRKGLLQAAVYLSARPQDRWIDSSTVDRKGGKRNW